jgi:hypothetical protein
MAAVVALAGAVNAPTYGARDANAVLALVDTTKIGTEAERTAELARVKAAYPGLFIPLGSANGGAQGGAVQAEVTGMARVSAAYAANQQSQQSRRS